MNSEKWIKTLERKYPGVDDTINRLIPGVGPEIRLRTKGKQQQNYSWGEKLCLNGFNSRTWTIWVIEGLFMYLSETQVTDIAHEILQLSWGGSCIIHDGLSSAYLREKNSMIDSVKSNTTNTDESQSYHVNLTHWDDDAYHTFWRQLGFERVAVIKDKNLVSVRDWEFPYLMYMTEDECDETWLTRDTTSISRQSSR